MPNETKPCVICGTEFVTRQPRVEACSRKCGLELRSRRRAARTDLPQPNPARGSHITDQHRRTTTVSCPVCSNPFEQRKDGRPQTCSKTCGYVLKGRRHSEFWERRFQERGVRPRRIMPNGYVQVQLSPEERKGRDLQESGFILEHRFVMEQHLGRHLLNTESVHHINGDRRDNRLENLELWNSRHGPGQRVSDLVAFAHETLALYGTGRDTLAHCPSCTCFGGAT